MYQARFKIKVQRVDGSRESMKEISTPEIS
jgi:hypothetical protein